jgi:hypothetical protein
VHCAYAATNQKRQVALLVIALTQKGKEKSTSSHCTLLRGETANRLPD